MPVWRAAQLPGNELGNGCRSWSRAGGTDPGEDFYFKEFDSRTNGGMARGLDGDKSAVCSASLIIRDGRCLRGLLQNERCTDCTVRVVFNDPRTQTVDAMQFLSLGVETALSSTSTLNVRVYQTGIDYHGQYPYDIMNYDAPAVAWWGGGPVALGLPDRSQIDNGAEFRESPCRYSSWSDAAVYSYRTCHRASTRLLRKVSSRYSNRYASSAVSGLTSTASMAGR